MVLRTLAIALLEGGAVRLPLGADAPEPDDSSCDDLLQELNEVARLHAPRTAPAMDLGAARWGLATTCRIAQLILERDVDAASVEGDLRDRLSSAPDPESTSSVWSVDLALARLVDLERLARGLAPSDPLLAGIRHVGAQWPLSSIGLRADAVDSGAREWPPHLREHPCLRRLFLDRVIERADLSWLANDDVRRALAAALGPDPQRLAPSLASALHLC